MKRKMIMVAAMCIMLTSTACSQTKNKNLNKTETKENVSSMDFKLKDLETVDFEKLASFNLPVIVDYGSDSCIPCKQMAPALEKLNEEFQGKAFVKFVDVWKYRNAANNVPVQVIPTQVIFDADGKPFMPSEELQKKIEFTMYQARGSEEIVFTVHQGGLTYEQMKMILAEMGVE